MVEEPWTEGEPRWWQAPWEFAVHALVGTLIFALIAAPAVGINLSIHWLESNGVSSPVILALEIGEYALLLADLLLFLMFLWRTSLRAVRKF
jgi:hypothetical protein